MISFAKIATPEQSQNQIEIKCTLKNEIVIDNIDQTNKSSYVHVIHNPHGNIIQKTIKQSSLHKATQAKNTQVVLQDMLSLKVEIAEETQKRSTSPIQKLISQEVLQIKSKQLIQQNKIVQINKSPRRTKPIFPKIQQNSKQKQQLQQMQQQNASFISVKSKNLNRQKTQINQYSHIQAINQQDMGCSIFSDFLSRKVVIKTNFTQNGNRNQRSLSNRKKIFSKQKIPRKISIKKQQILQQLIKLGPKQRKTSTDIKQTSASIKRQANQSNQKLVNQSHLKQNIESTKPMIKKLGGNRQTKNSTALHKLIQIQITKLATINPLSF